MDNYVSVCLINDGSLENIKKVINALEENQENIKEVIYSGSIEELPDTELPIKALNINSENKALLRNETLKEATQEWILFCSTSTEIEDTTLEEFFDVLEEAPNANIIYPNTVNIFSGEETVNNYDNLYENRYIILQGLTIERYIPEWGILINRSLLEGKSFNENFKEYEFYEFFLRNIDNIKPVLSELSFINIYKTETFIDTSYGSKLVRDYIVKKYFPEELFPNLSWDENKELALSTAYTMIGDALTSYHDFYNASDFYRKALISFHNQHTLKKLINSYINMGLFENAKQLVVSEQGLSKEEIEELEEYISKIQSLIKELENKVEEGLLDEVLYTLNDVLSVYQGAPLYNIAGVISFYRGDIINAYRFFYKAVIINPLEENILRNLTDVAKQIGKEEEVLSLVNRLLK